MEKMIFSIQEHGDELYLYIDKHDDTFARIAKPIEFGSKQSHFSQYDGQGPALKLSGEQLGDLHRAIHKVCGEIT